VASYCRTAASVRSSESNSCEITENICVCFHINNKYIPPSLSPSLTPPNRVVETFRQQFSTAHVRTVNTVTSAHFALGTNKLLSHSEVNLLKPTGHVMHQQFNIQQLYVLPTLYLCVLYLSENKQRLVPLTA
jgi:hypothetical protein